MTEPDLTSNLIFLLIVAPAFGALVLVLFGMIGWPLAERGTRRLTGLCLTLAVLAGVSIAVTTLQRGGSALIVDYGSLITVHDYSFQLLFMTGRLNVGWILLSTLILSLIHRFSAIYMHREPGYGRFSFLLLTFASALFILEAAGNIDLLFAGWEMIGLTSVLLIAYFWERDMPVRRALYVFTVYRIADLGLLAGVVLLHHFAHATDWQNAAGAGDWPLMTAHLQTWQATLLGGLFLIAAAGKSAQFPVTTWLPRAMEGPTPSSALFYGALSVHLGGFLLLRVSPLLDEAPYARSAIFAIGALTALSATFIGRTQNDAKNALAYGTVTQIGIVFCEIALQLYTVAQAHLLCNIVLRAFQFLNASNALAEHLERRAAIPTLGPAPVPQGAWYRTLYWLAVERFMIDSALERFIIRPVTFLARGLARIETWYERALFAEMNDE